MIWLTAGFLAWAAGAPLLVMIDQPVTVALPVAQAAKHSPPVLLKMEGVLMNRAAPAAWNVYWDKADEAHLVGYVSSPANSALRNPKPANFTLELPAAAVIALRHRTTIRLTFVPVRKLPAGGVTITSARLE